MDSRRFNKRCVSPIKFIMVKDNKIKAMSNNPQQQGNDNNLLSFLKNQSLFQNGSPTRKMSSRSRDRKSERNRSPGYNQQYGGGNVTYTTSYNTTGGPVYNDNNRTVTTTYETRGGQVSGGVQGGVGISGGVGLSGGVSGGYNVNTGGSLSTANTVQGQTVSLNTGGISGNVQGGNLSLNTGGISGNIQGGNYNTTTTSYNTGGNLNLQGGANISGGYSTGVQGGVTRTSY